MTQNVPLRVLGFTSLLMCVLSVPAAEADSSHEISQEALDAKIATLIRELGDTEYATREKAHSELERLGLVAFDALHQAQSDDDLEIAMRARNLIDGMKFQVSEEEDPPEVKQILREYGGQNQRERQSRMEKLSRLEQSAGIPALCRLVRYERAGLLSKRAALLVLNHNSPRDSEQRQRIAKQIKSAVGVSKRPSSDWVRNYAETLVDPESSLQKWDRLTTDELEVFTRFPERSSREIVRDLLRWQAKQLLEVKQQDNAVAVMRRAIDLLDGSREQILDMVDWLMEREAWVIVDEVADRFSARFHEDALLLYRLAESKQQRGLADEANALAKKAIELTPEEADAHIVTAFSLQDRGLFKWAEQEYRWVMKTAQAGSLSDQRARLLLSELLHDVEQEQAAATVLQGAVAVLETDAAARETLANRLGRDLGSVKSRMHYFYARQYKTDGDLQKMREHLEKGAEADPTDADVLIAMKRLPNGDAAWREKTKQLIDKAAGHFRGEVENYERQAARAPNEPIREWAHRQLATNCNQFAWLVGNTAEINQPALQDEALLRSKKSLELRPDEGGYLDTLGRCYFAKGDLENAVRVQRRAVEMEPHSLQIQRQLAEFEDALKATKKSLKEESATESDSRPKETGDN